jgi:CO/xanthine dehydrogenase Mo-binding subunit
VHRAERPDAARKKATEKSGRLRGRAVSFYIEFGGIFNDRMDLRFDPSGALSIFGGTHSHGQGHATVLLTTPSGRKSDPACPRFDVRLALSSSPGGASCRLQAMKNCLAEYVLT